MTAVLKIGGSLTRAPGRLRAILAVAAEGAHGACIVVPGGGAFADAVRAAQGREGFDEAEAHRRALDAMGRMAELFHRIEPRLPIGRTPWTDAPHSLIWDPAALRPGHLDIPESWDVTSDSLALWLAARLGARLCALVKSADAAPGLDPAALAQAGLVDAAFPAFAARFSGALAVWGPGGPVPVHRRVAA